MKEHVLLGNVPKCETCGGYVKPDIVFFGEDVRVHSLYAGYALMYISSS